MRRAGMTVSRMVGQHELLKQQHTTSGFLLLKVACTKTKDCAIYEMLIARNHTAERKTLSSEGNNWQVREWRLADHKC